MVRGRMFAVVGIVLYTAANIELAAQSPPSDVSPADLRPLGNKAVPRLVDILKGKKPKRAKEAAVVLALIGNPTAERGLIESLQALDEAMSSKA